MNKFTPSLRRLIVAGGILLSSATAFSQYCIPAYTTGTAEGDFIDGVTENDRSMVIAGGTITEVLY